MPPPDRADYLARTLITRMHSLEKVLAEDAGQGAARRRLELVEKILAVEAGVLDGSTHRVVLAALPSAGTREVVSTREQAEFAAFLRQHVALEV